MAPFSTFIFSTKVSKRNQTVEDVMPTNSGLQFLVLLTDAYIFLDKTDTHITGFFGLQAVTKTKTFQHAVESARARGTLTEGARVLPANLMQVLTPAKDCSIYVREWLARKHPPQVTTCNAVDFNSVLSASSLSDEVDICDSSQTWYMRFRSDDPLMFLAVYRESADKIMNVLPDVCMQVKKDFLYAA